MSQPAPASHFNLFLLRNFLDAETCAQLREELTEAPTTQAPVYIQAPRDWSTKTFARPRAFILHVKLSRKSTPNY